MARYQYQTIQMNAKPDKGFVRWEEGTPESALHDVLADFAEKGWRYVGFVQTGHLTSYPSGKVIFEREIPS